MSRLDALEIDVGQLTNLVPTVATILCGIPLSSAPSTGTKEEPAMAHQKITSSDETGSSASKDSRSKDNPPADHSIKAQGRVYAARIDPSKHSEGFTWPIPGYLLDAASTSPSRERNLRSLGNTCYMSACIQLLNNIPELRKALDKVSADEKSAALDIKRQCETKKALLNIMKRINERTTTSGPVGRDQMKIFFAVINGLEPSFKKTEHDPCDFWKCIIQALLGHDSPMRVGLADLRFEEQRVEYYQRHVQQIYQDHDFANLQFHQIVHQWKCRHLDPCGCACDTISEQFAVAPWLQVDVRPDDHGIEIHELLGRVFELGAEEGECALEINMPRRKRTHTGAVTRLSRLTMLPRILVILFKRQNGFDVSRSIRHVVHLPHKLDMSPYCTKEVYTKAASASPIPSIRGYRLLGGVYHVPGQFKAYKVGQKKNGDAEWVCFDDTQPSVSRHDLDPSERVSAIMLLLMV